MPLVSQSKTLYPLRGLAHTYTCSQRFWGPLVDRVLCINSSAGFKAVEWGADITYSYSKEKLVAAKKEANVDVIGLCSPLG